MIKNRRLHIVSWLIVLTGCTKDVAQFSPTPLSDTAWVQQVSASAAVAGLRDTLRYAIATDTVQLSQTDTLLLGSISCILPGSGWTTGQGSSYTGAAIVRARLFDKPGELIREFAGTLVQGSPVSVDAVVYLEVTVGGAALTPKDTIGFTTGDSLWSGDYEQNSLQWNTPGGPPGVLHTGWFLFGSTAPGGVNTLTVTLPSGFSNANTAVFCWMPGKRVLSLLQGDYNTRSFATPGMPTDSQATIVSLTSTGAGYYLGAQTATISGGQVSVALTPGTQTLGYITSYLEQL